MSEGALLSARCRIRIFSPEPVFGYFLQEQKVTRRQAKPDAPPELPANTKKEFRAFAPEQFFDSFLFAQKGTVRQSLTKRRLL